jgi:hypothetical protein
MSALVALASLTHDAVSFLHCESQLSLDPSSAHQEHELDITARLYKP